MGAALKTDNKVANMPQIRVVARNLDHKPINFSDINNHPLTTKNLLGHQPSLTEPDHMIPEYTATKADRKPRIDYQ